MASVNCGWLNMTTFFDEVEIFIYCFIPGLILVGSFETPNGWMLLLLFVLPYLVSALFRYVFKTAFRQTFSQYLKDARMRNQQAQADSMDSREALAHQSQVSEKLQTSQSRQHHRLMDVFCFVLGPGQCLVFQRCSRCHTFCVRGRVMTVVFEQDFRQVRGQSGNR